MFNYNLLPLLSRLEKETEKQTNALKVVRTTKSMMSLVDSGAFIALIFAASFTLPYFIATIMITGLLHRTVKFSLQSKIDAPALSDISTELALEMERQQSVPTIMQSQNELTKKLISLANRKNVAQRMMRINSAALSQTDEGDEEVYTPASNSVPEKTFYQIKKELKTIAQHVNKLDPLTSSLSPNKINAINTISSWLNDNPKQMYKKITIPSIVDFYFKQKALPHFRDELMALASALNENELNYADILLSSKYRKENLIDLIICGYKLKPCDFEAFKEKMTESSAIASLVNSALTTAALSINASFPGPVDTLAEKAQRKAYLESIWDFASANNLSSIDDVATHLNMPTQKEWLKNQKEKPNQKPVAHSPSENNNSAPLAQALPPVLSAPDTTGLATYNGITFNFKENAESQKLWSHTVEILNYFDTNPKAFDSLNLEHQVSIKQAKNLTIPQLHNIYKAVQEMPSITKMGLLSEVDQTLLDTHALLEGIMTLSATSVLHEVQGLKLYANSKRRNLG